MDLNFRVFVPFTKKNDDERIVEGLATSEALDSHGEVVKFEGIKKALPNYMKYGNIREMHQWSAVGKAIAAVPDEARKAVMLTAKVVDDQAWAKCKEGVYSGFSIGGKILKKLGNAIEELELNEISLVDRPANPESEFSLVKMNTGNNLQKYGSPEAPDGLDEQPQHLGIKFADRMIAMATQLTWMCEELGEYKRTKTASLVEKAIKELKAAAMSELMTEKIALESKRAEETTKASEAIKEVSELANNLKLKKSFGENWTNTYFEKHRKVI